MQTTRSACRSRFRRAPRPPLIALVVPYRPQAEQDRAAQLAAFLEHTARFLSASAAARFVVIVAQQSDDGRKFNRGALLNAGFREAQRLGIASVVFHDVDVCEARRLGTLASVIFHDVDLLPSAGLLRHYCAPPARGECVHLAGAGAWSKYDLAGYADAFLGGVAAFQPDDFARCNGFPNDYWGWGLEDDQLRLRAAASGVRVVRPPAGAGRFDDLDELALLGALNRPAERARKRHLLNERFLELRGAPLPLDAGWRDENGLLGLRYAARERRTRQLPGGVRCLHVLVELG